MKKLIMGLAIAAGLLLPQMSYGEFIKIKGSGWDSELSGDIKLSQSTLLGTSIDLKNDLGIKQTSMIPELEFKLNLPVVGGFIASYGMGSYDGRRTIAQDINFGGKTYNASDTLTTSMDVTVGSLMKEWVFVPKSLVAAFPSVTSGEFGLLVGVQYLGLETSVRSGYANLSNEEKINVPVPVIGGLIQMGFMEDRLQFGLSLTGFNLNSLKAGPATISANYFDISVDVKMNVYKNIPIGIGYKAISLNTDVETGETFSADFALKGLYLFTAISF